MDLAAALSSLPGAPWSLVLLVPVVVGNAYALLTVVAIAFFLRPRPALPGASALPPVTLLKPICGVDKGLIESLDAACSQDHPEYQVVLCVQRADDPALPLLRDAARRHGEDRVCVVVGDAPPQPNGKIENLIGALPHARHDLLVISDSDVFVPKDYLRTITAPLAAEDVAFVCTFYRAVCAGNAPEKLEALTLHDFTTNLLFAAATGASDFCLGSSLAFRRQDLDAIGGFEALGSFLVEDYEMGRRLQALGGKPVLLPAGVDTAVDLASLRAWWDHQLYWEQNTLGARPIGYSATILIKAVPFALAFSAATGFAPASLAVLATTLGVRVATAALNARRMGDRETLHNLAWLPVRDVLGLATWAGAFFRRKVVWRGNRFELNARYEMTPEDS